jgi:hypothetical protein
MLSNFDLIPKDTDSYIWADFLELRAISHPDKCFSKGELDSLIRQVRSTGVSTRDSIDIWREAKDFIKDRIIKFSASYPFTLSEDEDVLELTQDAPSASQKFYLLLLICSNMSYIETANNKRNLAARAFESSSLVIFTKLMPEGSEVHCAWASPGAPSRYTGSLFEKYHRIAQDIRAIPTFTERDFKVGNHGDGGIDIVAWHPMTDTRVAIPSALAQCGCSKDDWNKKHLEASPAKLRAKLNPHHAWANYYFMPNDLRWDDGDWAYKSDFGDAIMVDRLRLTGLSRLYNTCTRMPSEDIVAECLALSIQ